MSDLRSSSSAVSPSLALALPLLRHLTSEYSGFDPLLAACTFIFPAALPSLTSLKLHGSDPSVKNMTMALSDCAEHIKHLSLDADLLASLDESVAVELLEMVNLFDDDLERSMDSTVRPLILMIPFPEWDSSTGDINALLDTPITGAPLEILMCNFVGHIGLVEASDAGLNFFERSIFVEFTDYAEDFIEWAASMEAYIDSVKIKKPSEAKVRADEAAASRFLLPCYSTDTRS